MGKIPAIPTMHMKTCNRIFNGGFTSEVPLLEWYFVDYYNKYIFVLEVLAIDFHTLHVKIHNLVLISDFGVPLQCVQVIRAQ